MSQSDHPLLPRAPLSVAEATTLVLPMREGRVSKFARLASEMQAIEAEEARQAGEVGYINKVTIQATLPYREPDASLPAWGRRAGLAVLVLQPGVTMDHATGTPMSIGYPYGVIPRMFIAWLGREIKRHKSREIALPENISAFMRDIGIESVTGGKTGSIQAVKRQLQRLTASRITLLTLDKDAPPTDYTNYEGMQIADKAKFWWANDSQQDSPFGTRLLLSEQFYNAFSSAVPVDLRVMRLLNQSPLELDLYCWLTYRLCFLRKRTAIPWEALQGQFGTETQEPRKFRWLVRKALRSVRAVYPEARLDDSSDAGLVLFPSPPSIAIARPIDLRA